MPQTAAEMGSLVVLATDARHFAAGIQLIQQPEGGTGTADTGIG